MTFDFDLEKLRGQEGTDQAHFLLIKNQTGLKHGTD